MTPMTLKMGAVVPSPMGRGWREAPGEGVGTIDRTQPLTLSLSLWERGPEATGRINAPERSEV
jgi:hypothetical protein